MSGSRSRYAVVSALVAADIVWRFPLRLVGLLPEWVAPLLSVGAGVGNTPVLAEATTWLLFLVSFFVFTEAIYPDSASLPVGDTGFRLLVAVSGVAIGLGLGFATGERELLVALFGPAIASGGLFALYFRYGMGWTLLRAESPITGPLEVLDAGVVEEFEADLRADTVVSSVNVGVVLIASVGLVVVPCILLGLVSRILIQAYPVADVVVLAILLGNTRNADRVPGVRVVIPAARTLDIESRLHEGIETATRNIKGLFLTIYAFLGAFLGGGLLGIAVVGVDRVVLTDTPIATVRAFAASPLSGWVTVGILCLVCLAGVHGLWVWLREFRRLTAYVAYWEDDIAVASSVAPSRPVGMTLPPTLLMMLLGLFSATGAQRAFAVAWPIAAVATLGCLWLTRRRATSSIVHEDHVVVASLLVHTSALPAFLLGEEIWQFVTTGEAPVEAVLGSPALVIGIMVVGLPYFPDVERYAERFDDARRLLEGAYIVSIGVCVQFASLPADGGTRFLGTLVLLVTVGFAVVGTVVEELGGERCD